MPVLDEHTTVGQLVAERPSRSRVFERFGVDYCCGGKKSLELACKQKGLDVQSVIDELASNDGRLSADDQIDWTKASLTDLADHIEEKHHGYLREALPRLSGLIWKVVGAHGDKHPELLDVQDIFARLRCELEMHTNKEEMILFPMCRELEFAQGQPHFHCGSIKNPIFVMEMDHDLAGNSLARLRTLTHDYTPPDGACNTYRAMLDGLAELEADLHLHIHKENNILFPRAVEREAALTGAH